MEKETARVIDFLPPTPIVEVNNILMRSSLPSVKGHDGDCLVGAASYLQNRIDTNQHMQDEPLLGKLELRIKTAMERSRKALRENKELDTLLKKLLDTVQAYKKKYSL